VKAAGLRTALGTLPPAWRAVLPGWTPARLAAVADCVERVSADREIAPDDPLRALRLLAPGDVKVVVVGQDPYPTAGHADGLAVSAGKGRPRSLARLFEVLAADRPEFVPPDAWRLDDWARRGVLLLNPVLTVEVGRSGSHDACGWQALTREVIEVLARRAEPPAVLLWGAKAQAFHARADPDGRCRAWRTRHPSYDFRRDFMKDESHFAATADLVDWWAIGRPQRQGEDDR
jgi:uracil-DNA glycosylase